MLTSNPGRTRPISCCLYVDSPAKRGRAGVWQPLRGGGLALLTVLVGLIAWGGCVMPARVTGGSTPLTYETIFGPQAVDFDGQYARGLSWRPDGQRLQLRSEGVLVLEDALSGAQVPAYDHDRFAAVLALNEAFNEANADWCARRPELLHDDYSIAVLDHKDRLYAYRFDDQTLTGLTPEPAERETLGLSPQATYVTFTVDHDLYCIDLRTGVQTRLTADGSETLLNGILDWVYQEEVFGRGRWRACWWSADETHLAYLQLDDSEVPVYPLVDYLATHPTSRLERYPKAGDPNPKPRLGVVSPDGGATVWVDLSGYADADIIVHGVQWSPDGRLIYCVKDRESRWLDLNEADPNTGEARTLLRETSPAWVDLYDGPRWLDDGSFLWRSARDGWAHLYRYTRDGELIRQITSGEWEVQGLLGVDEPAGWVYFSGQYDTAIETHAYRIQLTGGEIQRLTEPGASHRVSLDPTCHYFIDTFSSVLVPPRVHLRRSDGELVRVLSENDVPALAEYRFCRPEFVRVPTSRGYSLKGMLLRPPHWNPLQRYPAMVFTYGGPHGPVVHNRWGRDDGLFKQLLAQEGYLVWTVDPYSASGESARSAWHCYLRLGVTELADLEDSLAWLGGYANADLGRVGIAGHSYGGFMVAHALTHSTAFKIGIAAAAVTDWRNYDSIYTEAFMSVPEKNPDGYEQASAVAAAGRLHGRLLLGHGLLDDNVHAQNAFQFIHALQHAGRDCDVEFYAADDHGLYGNGDHWQRRQYEFIRQNL